MSVLFFIGLYLVLWAIYEINIATVIKHRWFVLISFILGLFLVFTGVVNAFEFEEVVPYFIVTVVLSIAVCWKENVNNNYVKRFWSLSFAILPNSLRDLFEDVIDELAVENEEYADEMFNDFDKLLGSLEELAMEVTKDEHFRSKYAELVATDVILSQMYADMSDGFEAKELTAKQVCQQVEDELIPLIDKYREYWSVKPVESKVEQ